MRGYETANGRLTPHYTQPSAGLLDRAKSRIVALHRQLQNNGVVNADYDVWVRRPDAVATATSNASLDSEFSEALKAILRSSITDARGNPLGLYGHQLHEAKKHFVELIFKQ